MNWWIFAIAALFFCISFYMTNNILKFLSTCLRVQATIIKLERQARGFYPIPIFQFTDSRTGREIIGQGNTGMNAKIGKVINILYDPNNPEIGAKVDSFPGIWLGPIILAVIGCLWLFASLFTG